MNVRLWTLAVLGVAPDPGAVKVLAEFTLVLVLFSDASRVGLRDLRADAGLCVRLLVVRTRGSAVARPNPGLWLRQPSQMELFASNQPERVARA